MQRLFVAVLGLGLLTGCTATVVGSASPAPTSAPRPGAVPTMPPAATQSLPECLIGDTCGDDPIVVPATGPDCSSLDAAVASFESSAFASGRAAPSSTRAQEQQVSDIVERTVQICGWQAMVDIAKQFDTTLYLELMEDAYDALGEIVLLPEGLFCHDLQSLGLAPRAAVDYWYYNGRPDNMDADLNGVPCETVWPDAGEYVPAWY